MAQPVGRSRVVSKPTKASSQTSGLCTGAEQPGAGLRGGGPYHNEEVDRVEVSLVRGFKGKPHNVDGIEGSSKGQQIQQRVDVVLHHETV